MLHNFLVSIVVCTCNRAEHLRLTLESMAGISVSQDIQLELIVVDNASTDETEQVIKSCKLPNMSVRYIREARRGKSYAYNTGMDEAQGDVLLFTDDDVRPSVNWIEGMCRPILLGEADAVAGGVQIAPHLIQPWMTEVYRCMLASTEEIEPNTPWAMIGANMAFGKHVRAQVPQFDPRLGPGDLGAYEESLFSWQLKEAGFKIVSALDVVVEHHPDPARFSRDHLLETRRKWGRSLAYIDYHWHHKSLKAVRVRRLLRQAKLSLTMLIRRKERYCSPFPTTREMNHVQIIALFDQYLIESKHPRNYEKKGLKRIR